MLKMNIETSEWVSIATLVRVDQTTKMSDGLERDLNGFSGWIQSENSMTQARANWIHAGPNLFLDRGSKRN